MIRRRVRQIAADHAIAPNATSTATRTGPPAQLVATRGAEVREVYGPPRG
jgi:hypothetical protein